MLSRIVFCRMVSAGMRNVHLCSLLLHSAPLEFALLQLLNQMFWCSMQCCCMVEVFAQAGLQRAASSCWVGRRHQPPKTFQSSSRLCRVSDWAMWKWKWKQLETGWKWKSILRPVKGRRKNIFPSLALAFAFAFAKKSHLLKDWKRSSKQTFQNKTEISRMMR